LVIDYNTGNVDSVIKALKLFSKDVKFSSSRKDLDQAYKIILPGQGSYDHAINELKRKNLFEIIKKKHFSENIPIMGICLGMQILSTYGYENHQKTEGLNIIPGEVIKMEQSPNSLPHIAGMKYFLKIRIFYLKTYKTTLIFTLYIAINLYPTTKKI